MQLYKPSKKRLVASHAYAEIVSDSPEKISQVIPSLMDAVEATTSAEVWLLLKQKDYWTSTSLKKLISRVQTILAERQPGLGEVDDAEKKYLAVCNYILAKALFAYGMDSQEQGEFEKAIEHIRKH